MTIMTASPDGVTVSTTAIPTATNITNITPLSLDSLCQRTWQAYKSIPWSSQFVQGTVALLILGMVVFSQGASAGGWVVEIVLPAALLIYLYRRVHPVVAVAALFALLHLAAVRAGGFVVAVLGGVVDAGLALWAFFTLLQPTQTAEYHWFLRASYRIDTFLDPTIDNTTMANNSSNSHSRLESSSPQSSSPQPRRIRSQSILVAGLGAVGVMCLCFLPLGFTAMAREVRHYREHPCEGIRIHAGDIPPELEAYLSSSSSAIEGTTTPVELPDFCQATQHGNVYELGGRGGTLFFTGNKNPNDPHNVLFSFQEEHDNQHMMSATTTSKAFTIHDKIRNPSRFTSVTTPGKKGSNYLCFLALDDKKRARTTTKTSVYCIDANLTIQKAKRLSVDADTAAGLEMFGFGGRLWIRERLHRFHTIQPDKHMKVETNDRDFSLSHGMLQCMTTNPLLALCSLLISVVAGVGTYHVLWKHQAPSAGATAWWSLMFLVKWFTNRWLPDMVLLVVAVVILYTLLVLQHPTQQHHRHHRWAVVVAHHRLDILWLLYGGLYPTMLLLDDASMALIVTLFVSAVALQHTAIILVWCMVLVNVIQDLLVHEMEMSRVWAVLVSVVSILGAAHLVSEYWSVTVSFWKRTLQRRGVLAESGVNDVSEKGRYKDDDVILDDYNDDTTTGDGTRLYDFTNVKAEAFLAGGRGNMDGGDGGSVSSRSSTRSGTNELV